jgi:hypothetical protein
MIIKAVGYAAGVEFIFDFSFTDWGIGLLLVSAAVAVVCVFIWTHFDLGDTYDEDETPPTNPNN